MKRIRMLGLTADVASTLRSQIEAGGGCEVCGVLFGNLDRPRGVAIASGVLPLPSLCPAVDRFELDPRALVQARAAARSSGQRVLALYHSHPHGMTAPSTRDLWLPGITGWLMLIIALDGRRTLAACYGAGGRNVYPVEVVAPYPPGALSLAPGP